MLHIASALLENAPVGVRLAVVSAGSVARGSVLTNVSDMLVEVVGEKCEELARRDAVVRGLLEDHDSLFVDASRDVRVVAAGAEPVAVSSSSSSSATGLKDGVEPASSSLPTHLRPSSKKRAASSTVMSTSGAVSYTHLTLPTIYSV